MAKMKISEVQTLEKHRVALENIVNQARIANIMKKFGYDETLIAEGKALWQSTRNAYNLNKTKDDQTSEAYAIFNSTKEKIFTTYTLHRKKAKVIFRKDELTTKKLGITGRLPKAYIKWLETVKKFYTIAIADTAIQAKLARLKITTEDLSATTSLISALEAARAKYLRKKGESQDATKSKDQVFATLEDWMSELYAIATIALENNPQLLESLSKTVKN